MTMTGHCLCGAVRYRVDEELGFTANCHCSFCRRAHGAPFVPVSLVARSAFQYTAGEDQTRVFDTSGGGSRVFCTQCGTRICNLPRVMPDHLSLVVATLDDEHAVRPNVHINVESKAPWYEIADDLPQFDALPKAPGASTKDPE
jgi:hypothetical protein